MTMMMMMMMVMVMMMYKARLSSTNRRVTQIT